MAAGAPGTRVAGPGLASISTPARLPNTSVNTARKSDFDSAELVSRQTATRASGSIRR